MSCARDVLRERRNSSMLAFVSKQSSICKTPRSEWSVPLDEEVQEMAGMMKFAPRSSRPNSAPRKANRAWAGRGTGVRCDLCHEVIEEDQVEYEVELPDVPDRALTLHLQCYQRWTLSRDVFGEGEVVGK